MNTINNSLLERYEQLLSEAVSRVKAVLTNNHNGYLELTRPVTLTLSGGDGFCYFLEAEKILLLKDTLHVFCGTVTKRDVENGNVDFFLPDQYWKIGGDFSAEAEGLFALFDGILLQSWRTENMKAGMRVRWIDPDRSLDKKTREASDKRVFVIDEVLDDMVIIKEDELTTIEVLASELYPD